MDWIGPPENIGPSFEDVLRAASRPAVTRSGETVIALDASVFDRIEGRFGKNGGRPCDVLEGPCSCGAWH